LTQQRQNPIINVTLSQRLRFQENVVTCFHLSISAVSVWRDEN